MNCKLDDIDHFCIWGNHSPTMYPDTTNMTVNGNKVSD